MNCTKGVKLFYDDSCDLSEGEITEIDGEVQNQVGHILPNFRDKYGRLFPAAVNACIELNPDNPIAVAESIGKMYEACKKMIAVLNHYGSDQPEPEFSEMKQVLAKVEGG